MDSPVHWECREADQHTTLCYGRSIEVCMRFLERMRRAQVAFTRPDAIDYSAHDLAHSIPSYLSRGCIGRKRFNKKFHNGLPWTVPCLTDCSNPYLIALRQSCPSARNRRQPRLKFSPQQYFG